MSWDPKLILIRSLLADFYPQIADFPRVVEDAQLPIAQINLGGNNLDSWHNILSEAKTRNKLRTLIEICIEDKDSIELKIAYQSYQNNYFEQEAEIQLNNLLNDPNFNIFYPLFNKLKQQLSAGILPIVIFAFVDLVQQIQGLENAPPINEIITNIVDGNFIQDNWEFIDLYRTQRKIFDSNFSDFREELAFGLNNSVIPVVLVVMSAEQAEELNNGNILENFPINIRGEFDNLKTFLEPDWAGRYAEDIKNWKPFGSEINADTIQIIVQNKIDALSSAEKTIVPKFIDINSLVKKENRQGLKHLRDKNCIIIMDIVSMCHPLINSEFHESGLDVFENTYVFSIATQGNITEILYQMNLLIQKKITDMEFSKRMKDKDGEIESCQEINNENTFKTRFGERVTKMLASKNGVDRFFFSND